MVDDSFPTAARMVPMPLFLRSLSSIRSKSHTNGWEEQLNAKAKSKDPSDPFLLGGSTYMTNCVDHLQAGSAGLSLL